MNNKKWGGGVCVGEDVLNKDRVNRKGKGGKFVRDMV